MSGWAFVGCDICGLWKCAGGCPGSVQFRIDDGAQTGSCNFVFHTGSTISEPDTRLFLSGNLDVSGTINATNYNVINHTVSYLSSSGDSKFGDTFEDSHQFTGSLKVARYFTPGKDEPLFWVNPDTDGFGVNRITLGRFCTDIIHVSGTLTASCGIHVSGGLSISGTLDLCPGGTLKVSNIVACSPLSISASQVDVTSSIRISGSQQIHFGALGTNQYIHGDESGNTLTLHADGDLQFDCGGDRISWRRADATLAGEFALNSPDPTAWIFKDSTQTEVMRIDGTTHSLFVTGNLRVCDGTASIAHLSGCSPITVHAPMSSSTWISASNFYGSASCAETINISASYVDSAYYVPFISSSVSSLCETLRINDTLSINPFTDTVTVAGDLNVCHGTASIAHLSGCSGITVHSDMVFKDASLYCDSFFPLEGTSTTTYGLDCSQRSIFRTQLTASCSLYVVGQAGIGTDSPKVALDVHHSGATNPVNGGLGSKEAGGDVVFYGTGSSLAGAVYYLNEDGGWAQAQATDVRMGTGQLGIALGTNAASDGMLIRGFANVDTFLEGTMKAGKVLYVSHLNPGYMSHTAPTGSGEILRLTGHATSGSSNVIHFNPEVGWLELV